MNTKKLVECSILTSLALIIFVIELRIPNIVPIPGVKLGLANIITVYAVYLLSPRECAMIVVTRTVLGAFFAGNPSVLLYSFTGAMFALLGMLLLKKIIPVKYLWLCSVLGAVCHNTGQIMAAILVMGTVSIFAFYPMLIVSGCISGLITGIAAQQLVKTFKKLNF